MNNEHAIPYEYEQHLSDVIEQLYFSPRYESLRKRVEEESKDEANGIVFAVRKDEIHIYYKGGRLLKITKGKGNNLRFFFDEKYTKVKCKNYEKSELYVNPEEKNTEIAYLKKDLLKVRELNGKYPYDETEWLEEENWKFLKDCMTRYRDPKDGCSPNPERQLQHSLELCNRDFFGEVIVIDNEYAVRKLKMLPDNLYAEKFCKLSKRELEVLSRREKRVTREDLYKMSEEELSALRKECKMCKVDLVALYREDGKYKICLIELKRNEGAIDGHAGVEDHIADYEVFSEKRKADIVASVDNLINYKREQHTLYNVPKKVELGMDTEICFSILCYDLNSDKKKQSVKVMLDGKSLPWLHYNLNLNSNTLKLSRDMILGR